MAENMNFEKSMKRLEEIVALLEKGDVEIEKSLELFAEGTSLIKSCGKLLDEAEQKVMIITKGEDGLKEQPFSAGSEN